MISNTRQILIELNQLNRSLHNCWVKFNVPQSCLQRFMPRESHQHTNTNTLICQLGDEATTTTV